ILAHGDWHLDERIGAFLIESVVPVRDRECAHEEARSGLRLRPATRGAQLKDCKPLNRRVVRPAMRRDLLHASVLDAHLPPKEEDLASQALVLRLKPDSRVEIVCDPAARVSYGRPRQCDGVDDCGSHTSGPTLWECDVGRSTL